MAGKANQEKDTVAEFTSDGPIIGIDLGTSTSAIAFLNNDNSPELIPDTMGDRIIPSVVQISPEGEIIVGTVAKSSAITFHDRTVQEVKRLMGTDQKVKFGDKQMLPEEVSAEILKHLKATAEARFGPGSVRDVVLSVPARFENDAREATKRAAAMAGLNVIRLINEPTAAALSYGLNRLEDKQKVLVFDFGGGTLDVTILEMYKGVLDVKTSVGDDKLGGKDVDDAVIALFREVYKDQHNKTLPPASKDPKVAQTLKEEAETYKKRLSSTISIPVDMPYLTAEGGVNFLLTRAKLEELLEPMLMRAMTLVNAALARARLDWKDIDVILPVGGSSRIALFRRALEFAWGKEIRDHENPDEAVAKGAAIAAGIERKQFDEAQSIMILDVTPHRLGVATVKQVGSGQYVEDYFSEIIPKDAKLPVNSKREYGAIFGGSDTIFIRVFEAANESNLCRDHRMISEMTLNQMRGGADDEIVQVEFSYTLDGTLAVAARYVNAPMIKVEGTFNLNEAGEAVYIAQSTGPTQSQTSPSGLSETMMLPTGGSKPKANGITAPPVFSPQTPVSSPPPGSIDLNPIRPVEEVASTSAPSKAVKAAKAISAQQVASLWRKSPHAAHCTPLIEQAERAEQEHPDSARTIKEANEALKIALVTGTEQDVRQKLDALTDVLFDLA